MSKNDDLVRRLRETTEAMASQCSVDMRLWSEHSNACLEAADAIERGAAQGEDWRNTADAPKDGTLLRLLVKPDDEAHTSFDDSEKPYETIGFNHLHGTNDDVWQFAGWDWSHDCITQGYGEVIGWLPFSATPPAPAPDAGEEPDTDELLTIAYMMGAHSAKGPSPQPPAVEAEAVKEIKAKVVAAINDRRLAKSNLNHALHLLNDLAVTLKAKADEIERLRRERDKARAQALENGMALCRERNHRQAAEASNKALREELRGIRRALLLAGWEEGSLMIDGIDRALLSEKGA